MKNSFLGVWLNEKAQGRAYTLRFLAHRSRSVYRLHVSTKRLNISLTVEFYEIIIKEGIFVIKPLGHHNKLSNYHNMV